MIKQNESEFEHITFLVFYLVLFSIQRATFCKKPIKNWTYHCKVMTYWKVVKTIGNKRIYFLCLALSPNQYLRIPTHFAWSYHICPRKVTLLGSRFTVHIQIGIKGGTIHIFVVQRVLVLMRALFDGVCPNAHKWKAMQGRLPSNNVPIEIHVKKDEKNSDYELHMTFCINFFTYMPSAKNKI